MHLLVTYAPASALLFLHLKGDTYFRFLLCSTDLLQSGALANQTRSMKFVQIRCLMLLALPDVHHATNSGQRRQVAPVRWLVEANEVCFHLQFLCYQCSLPA